MALSNWDTLAVNETGESTNGIFVSKKTGVSVEFYKNWLYVRDSKGWQEGGRFVEPTVMEIQSGSLSYKDIKIDAIRGPQSGVYAVIHSTIYPPSLKEDCAKCEAKAKAYRHDKTCPDFVDTKHHIMIGCGVYGYSGEDWVGVTEESKKFLVDWIQKSRDEEMPLPRQLVNKLATEGDIRAHFAAKGQKVSRITEANIYIMYESFDFDDEVRNIDLSKALRFNKGDAYFATKTGTDIPATEPGTAEEPWLTQMLKKQEP